MSLNPAAALLCSSSTLFASNCQKTCGLCPSATQPPPPMTMDGGDDNDDNEAPQPDLTDSDTNSTMGCADNPEFAQFCPGYLAIGFCEFNATEAAMELLCSKTCGFCVADTIPPVITVNGKVLFVNNQLCLLSEYVELGATAEDDVDGDLTAEIVTGGDVVDTTTVGKYVVTFSVADAAGNTADAKRKVQVVECHPPPAPLDLVAPTISLKGWSKGHFCGCRCMV
eukprot:scaffold1073_cov383-Prasinococcus_capsulatus_cf.AAC.7